jgi:hypothetical protein
MGTYCRVGYDGSFLALEEAPPMLPLNRRTRKPEPFYAQTLAPAGYLDGGASTLDHGVLAIAGADDSR